MNGAAEHSVALTDLLRGLKLAEAIELVRDVRREYGDGVVSDVVGMTADTEEAGILAYTLVAHILSKHNEPLWHRIARDMLSNELCHYSHAYAASLLHAKEACDLEPNNVRNWELLIDIGSNRTNLLAEDEIREAADRIRKLDPDSKWGQYYGVG